MGSLVTLSPGSTFAGDYRIVRPLGEGGMGAVYVAEQISTGKQRALKVMHAQLGQDPMLRQRFVNEAKIGSQIDSDHIVDVLAAGIDAETGMPWLSMELLQGETLADRVERSAMPIDEVREVVSHLCHALAAAHDAGIIHRDLKPENVFLVRPRREKVRFVVKVLDFGIAKLLAAAGAQSTAAIGTPLWMAPEQASSDGMITPATDVWALGLLVFYMLTGKEYWKGAHRTERNPMALLLEAAVEPLEPASVRAAALGCTIALPPNLDGWFAQCVSRDLSARFGNARAAHVAFERMIGVPSQRPPATARAPAPAPAPAPAMAAVPDLPELSMPMPKPAPKPVVSSPPPTAATSVPKVQASVALPPKPSSSSSSSGRFPAAAPTPAPRIPARTTGAIASSYRGLAERETPPRRWGLIVFGAVALVVALAMAQRIFITGSLFGVRVFGSAPSQTAGGGTPKGVQGSSASSTSASAVAGPACPPEMMRVPGGAITGGGRATIMVESFCMDVSEVTVKAYAACLKRGKCTPAHASAKWPETGIDPSALLAVACNQGHGDRQEHPINCVDWSQANAFCTSSGKALPTDAQWDWAAHRGSARTKRPWGDDAPLLQVCWSNFTRRASTCPVASYIAGDNPWAIHDLEGNVREWTATSIGDDRLLCGIAWHDTRESISAVRDDCGRALKTGRAPFVGFRCVTE